MSNPSLKLSAQRAWSATAGRGGFAIAVTAVCREAGGSAFAHALAAAGADFGRRIVLVDAQSLSPGEAEDAEGTLALAPLSLRGYRIVGVAANSGLHRALNEPAHLAALLETWRPHADAVVLDLPPYGDPGAGVYAPLAASAADAVLMTGLPGVTEAHVMAEAVKWLADSGAALSGIILNDRANPTLAQEMLREAARLGRILPFFPRLAAWLVARWAPLHRYH